LCKKSVMRTDPRSKCGGLGTRTFILLLVLSIVHAVHVLIVRLDTHTGSIVLNPLAGLAAPAVTPLRRYTLDEHFIPAQIRHVVLGEAIILRLNLGQVVDVLRGWNKLMVLPRMSKPTVEEASWSQMYSAIALPF